jgi:hypothetical protein
MDDKARTWHKTHPMPKNPTVQQRIEWHLAHARHCACRPIPAGVAKLIAVAQLKPAAPRRDRKL